LSNRPVSVAVPSHTFPVVEVACCNRLYRK
jgi:hypothetical protein